jgi:hypothetical protein
VGVGGEGSGGWPAPSDQPRLARWGLRGQGRPSPRGGGWEACGGGGRGQIPRQGNPAVAGRGGGADPEEIGKILPRQRPELEGATRHWQEEESPRYGEGIPHRASDQLQGSLPVPQGNQAVAG